MTDPTGSGRRYLSASAKGGRDEQQDAVICLHASDGATALLVVSDGLGGESGGRLASQQVIKSAQDFWESRQGVLANPGEDLEEFCRIAHDRINEEGAKAGIRPHATIVALYLSEKRAHWIHSGDSRLYRFRAGKFVQRTEDHSLVQLMVKQNLAKEEEMGGHISQGLLVKSLGGDVYQEPSVDSAAIDPEDGFLLCSDGFWQRITVEEMQQLFKAGARQSGPAVEQAIKSAVQRNGPEGDNVTVALALPAASLTSATGPQSVYPKPAALPQASSRKPLVIASAGLALGVLVALGVFTTNELLNSRGASPDPSPAATQQQTPVKEAGPSPNDQQHPVPVVTTDTPPEASPKPTSTPDEQTVAQVTPTSDETPLPAATPSGSVPSVDPKLVGKWQAKTERGIETWIQEPDGHYTLSGPIDEKGTLWTEDDRMHQYFPSSNLTQELTYEVMDDGIITTAPDGKKMVWRAAGTVAETIHQPHPHHHVEEKPTFWQRLVRWFPFH